MTTFSHACSVRRIVATASLFVVAALAACKDFTAIDASFANVTDSDTVYALNGAPAGAVTAFKFFDGSLHRADQSFAFDVAFDIAADGRVVVLPAKAVATKLVPANGIVPYSVGILKSGTSFEATLEAPKDGYVMDSTVTVSVGETLVFQSLDLSICGFAIKGNSYFSKIVINNVDPATKKIAFTVTVNRNCGFRSFEPGIPRN
jgi:hypothetical protein